MIEVEPAVENVQPGDVVTIETGTLGEPGHEFATYRATIGWSRLRAERSLPTLRSLTRMGWRIARITRPAPPIPDGLGARFWARYEGTAYAEEFVVTRRNGETLFVSLHDGLTWTPEEHGESFTVVPAPEPETVPVPADLIREAEEWDDSRMGLTGLGSGILARIVRAVREREAGDE